MATGAYPDKEEGEAPETPAEEAAEAKEAPGGLAQALKKGASMSTMSAKQKALYKRLRAKGMSEKAAMQMAMKAK
jgi:hypothetical protein